MLYIVAGTRPRGLILAWRECCVLPQSCSSCIMAISIYFSLGLERYFFKRSLIKYIYIISPLSSSLPLLCMSSPHPWLLLYCSVYIHININTTCRVLLELHVCDSLIYKENHFIPAFTHFPGRLRNLSLSECL